MDTDERDAVAGEYRKLRRRSARGEDVGEQLAEVRGRLLVLVAVPPVGFEVPKAGRELVEHARAHGWEAIEQWTHGPGIAEPFYTVKVGRVGGVEAGRPVGAGWAYSKTWHSRCAAPGKVRLFGSGVAETPQCPRSHDAPSLVEIQRVVAAHPVR
ncbi:hypothetical protein F7Q99_36130 [Streptomyces kaniharaensis]|uniref:Uncharacterized protein n=1 Tax=Streptomyces kaniharaensis TaxID=212423 RepID=A0A6N7L1E5_9ACTN|nr:hypothetical protein [Streptomyces kaniharaensis]MQS17471.1 hypothetical protein [Streptomyces kaniharaensis]